MDILKFSGCDVAIDFFLCFFSVTQNQRCFEWVRVTVSLWSPWVITHCIRTHCLCSALPGLSGKPHWHGGNTGETCGSPPVVFRFSTIFRDLSVRLPVTASSFAVDCLGQPQNCTAMFLWSHSFCQASIFWRAIHPWVAVLLLMRSPVQKETYEVTGVM